MRSRLLWSVTLPLAFAGSEAGHVAANLLYGAPAGGAGELFQAVGRETLAPVVALVAAALVAALVGRAAGRWGQASRTVSALPFACLGPLVFVAQEHAELLLRHETALLAPERAPVFLPGLLLQIPFSLLAFLVARALLRLADRACSLLVASRPPAPLAVTLPLRVPVGASHPLRPVRDRAHPGRAPPRLVVAPV